MTTSFLFVSHNNASSCSECFPVLQILVGSYSSAVRHLDPKVEQLDGDADVVRDDLSQLIDKVPGGNFPQLIKLKLRRQFRRMTAILLNINLMY